MGPHPASEPEVPLDPKVQARRKKRGRRAQIDGYKAERDIFTRLCGDHNPTSIGYDGLIAGMRVEYKARLNGGSILPTKAEWEKAHNQGNRLVIVEDKETGEGTVTMSIETFERIRESL